MLVFFIFPYKKGVLFFRQNKHRSKRSCDRDTDNFLFFFCRKTSRITSGGVVLIFTSAEIDVLRLAAWCKDLPTGRAEIFPREIVELLYAMGLLRQSRCGLSYRATPKGYEVLQKGGFDYRPDKQYRGKGAILDRRLETAEITGFFWRYGADIFLSAPYAEKKGLAFLPSFALRRKTYANVLGGTRLAGFLYSEYKTFIPYYITQNNTGIYANVELRTFRAESLLCGRSPVVLYTGAGTLEQLIRTVTAERCKKAHSTTDSYLAALDKFVCEAALVPMDETGMRQLRILSVPEYKEKLLRQILGKDFLPPVLKQSDGRRRKANDHFLIGIDCNIARFREAIAQTDSKPHIIVLTTQAPALQTYLTGQNVVLHPIEVKAAEAILGIPHELPALNLSPFRTGKGEYLYGAPFRETKAPGRKSGRHMEKE